MSASSGTAIRVRVNGEWRTFERPMSIRDLLNALQIDVPPQGIAVAVNADVIPRDRWEMTLVRDGDSVEIVRAVSGGMAVSDTQPPIPEPNAALR